MERKFISRLFINKSKDGAKVYLKGDIRIAPEDISGFTQSDGSLRIPVFGHTFQGEDKLGNAYKAYNLEVIQDENISKETTKQDNKKGKKDYRASKSGDLDSPF